MEVLKVNDGLDRQIALRFNELSLDEGDPKLLYGISDKSFVFRVLLVALNMQQAHF